MSGFVLSVWDSFEGFCNIGIGRVWLFCLSWSSCSYVRPRESVIEAPGQFVSSTCRDLSHWSVASGGCGPVTVTLTQNKQDAKMLRYPLQLMS